MAANPAAVAEGLKTYNQTCQPCHGAGGLGDRGPALTTTAFAHGNDDADVFHSIRAGVPGTQMPPFRGLSDEQVWQLVSYIRSLQRAAPVERASAREADPPAGDAAAGEQLFAGKAACATCHEVNARGGITGPDLSNAGRLSAAQLRETIVNPNSGRSAVTVIVSVRDGAEIRGVRRNEDTFSLQLVDACRACCTCSTRRTLASVRVENRSLMPADYATRLSQDDINNIVAFLRTLHGRDPGKAASAAGLGAPGLTFDRLRNAEAEPHNWLTYWGDYQGTHFSALDADRRGQRASAAGGRGRCRCPGDAVLEGTPLVVDGVMYATGSGESG